jgi:hypothetical protein
MRVSSSVATERYQRPPHEGQVSIEFAIPAHGGNSSAGEKHGGDPEKAVRLAWRNADGSFDPISSAEIPLWGLMDVVEACARENFFDARDALTLITTLSQSAQRLLGSCQDDRSQIARPADP